MHIPDGYLGPYTYGGLWAAMLPVWYACSRRIKAALRTSEVPLLALGGAVSFVLMMINVPAPGGTSGHAVGAALLAIVLGPWAATMALSIALITQALVFGDGGITAIGANCFNMAFLGSMTGYAVFRLLSRGEPTVRKIVSAGAVAGYISINVSALFSALELGLQPVLHTGADGRPLYSPFPLKVTLPAIMIGHLSIFGFVEAAFTGFALLYLYKSHKELLIRNEKSI
jgi:cobalt/nickel transport system permease protein